MPRYKTVYAWIEGGKIYASLMPKESGGAANVYASPLDVVADASRRGMSVQWENPAAVDGWSA